MKSLSRLILSCGLIVPLLATWLVMAQSPDPEGSIRIGGTLFVNRAAFGEAGKRCATPEPTPAMRAAVAKALTGRNMKADVASEVVIPIQYIHITDGANGAITEQQRIDQTQVLNDAFNSQGFTFCYDPAAFPPREASNAEWFTMLPNSPAEWEAKTTMGRDPTRFLNFYTANPGDNILGWATFPFPFIDTDVDGVVCLYSSLPGGTAEPFNEGDTGTHEVGHWLGLFHTFDGGCIGSGDEVADTQAHPSPDYGCPVFGPSCKLFQSSPVHNFMNYVDDPCMDHFTSGQGIRARQITTVFRPKLGTVTTVCGTGTGGGCPLNGIAEATKRSLPFPLSQDDLNGLRKFRDVVLNKSEAGRALSQMYYRHGPQLVELMLKDPQLGGETLLFLARQMPAVERAVEQEGAVRLVRKDYDHGLQLLARYRKVAPTELARTLTQVESLLDSAASVGDDLVALEFPADTNAVGTALAPIPDPISTKTN